MNTIFIIGNGFDLAHGLKTSYNHFMEDLRKILKSQKDDSILRNNLLINILLKNTNLNNWSDIEYLYFQTLNNYNDTNYFQKNFNMQVRYSSSKKLDDDFQMIKSYLEKYLIQQQAYFKPFEPFDYLLSEFNSNDTMILDFNYTNTIKSYIKDYSNIKHIKIHGELENNSNPIIFGFAASNSESKILSEKNDEYLMKNIKKFGYLQTGNDVLLMESINGSEYININVYIVGHSCGVSDKLILNEIFNHSKISNITTFYYNKWDGYLQTAINIDRIIDDYTKGIHEPKSFQKLSSFKDSTKIIQHNSSKEDINQFKEYINYQREKQIKKMSDLFH